MLHIFDCQRCNLGRRSGQRPRSWPAIFTIIQDLFPTKIFPQASNLVLQTNNCTGQYFISQNAGGTSVLWRTNLLTNNCSLLGNISSRRYWVYQDENARTGYRVYQDEDAGSAMETKTVHWEIRCGWCIVWLTCLIPYALAFSYECKHFQWSKQRRGEHRH